jgi:hypothetical protein
MSINLTLIYSDGESTHSIYLTSRVQSIAWDKSMVMNIIDRMKTFAALYLGYKVVRIDFTQINHITEHFKYAFESDNKLYLSTPNMYYWLSQLPSIRDWQT